MSFEEFRDKSPNATLLKDREENPNDCCFRRCQKANVCNDSISCGIIKGRKNQAICCTIVGMIACLLLSIIGPLVLNVMLDTEIDYQVVIGNEHDLTIVDKCD